MSIDLSNDVTYTTNLTYSRIEGKTVKQLEAELRTVYDGYPEYHGGTFMAMVENFAGDDFYKLHYVACQYLSLRKEWSTVRVELLEDVINALANKRLMEMRGKDFVGCEMTTKLINRVKTAIDRE